MSLTRHLQAFFRILDFFSSKKAPLDAVPYRLPAAPPDVEQALHMASGAIAATLSLLDTKAHGLTAITAVALRQASSTASSVNQMVVDADQASEAVEELARAVTSIEQRSRSEETDKRNCNGIAALRSDAAQATRLSFGITVQAIQSRSTAKQLAASMDDIHRLATEVQTLTEEIRLHLEELANQVGGMSTAPPVPCNDECCRQRA